MSNLYHNARGHNFSHSSQQFCNTTAFLVTYNHHQVARSALFYSTIWSELVHFVTLFFTFSQTIHSSQQYCNTTRFLVTHNHHQIARSASFSLIIEHHRTSQSILGEPSKKKMGKVGLLDQPGGRGLTESQLFGKISQN